MAKSIEIRVATSEDYQEVLNLFRESYYKEEPITIAHPEPGHTKDDEDFTISKEFFDCGTVLLAIDAETGKIAGAASAGPIEHGDADALVEAAKTTETKKWREISLFLAFLEKKADVLHKYNVSKALHIQALGVHRDFRGNRIGEKLFNACFENAKKLKLPLVSTDCTSIFSIKIAERCGMERVCVSTYDEYHEKLGKKLFNPREPNLEIVTFIKRV